MGKLIMIRLISGYCRAKYKPKTTYLILVRDTNVQAICAIKNETFACKQGF